MGFEYELVMPRGSNHPIGLLITDACLCLSDIQYFQVGIIFEHIDAACWAAGAIVGALYQPFAGAIATTLIIWYSVPEIVFQISGTIKRQRCTDLSYAVDFVFYNVYNWSPSNPNPFQPLSDYCVANNTAFAADIILGLNWSASWGQVFGCGQNWSLDILEILGRPPPIQSSIPLDSPLATCNDAVVGCLVCRVLHPLV